MTKATPKKENSSAGGGPPNARSRWKATLLTLAIVIALFVGFLLLQSSRLRGDYREGLALAEIMHLSFDPLPRVSLDLDPTIGYMTPSFTDQPYGYYYPNFSGGFTTVRDDPGFVIPGYTPPPRPRLFGRDLAEWTRNPEYSYLFEHTDPVDGTRYQREWYPSGSLGPLRQAWIDQDMSLLIDLARRLDDELDGRPMLQYVIVEGHLMMGDYDGMVRELDRYRDRILTSDDPRGRHLVNRLEWIVANSDERYEEKFDRYFAALAADVSKGEVSNNLEETLQYIRDLGARKYTIPPAVLTGPSYNFLRFQVSLKIASTEAVFAAVQGDWDLVDEYIDGMLRAAGEGPLEYGPVGLMLSEVWVSYALLRLRDLYLHGPQSVERLNDRWHTLIQQLPEPLEFVPDWEEQLFALSGFEGTSDLDSPENIRVFSELQMALHLHAYRVHVFRLTHGEWPDGPSDPRIDQLGLDFPEWLSEKDGFNKSGPDNTPQPFSWKLEGDEFVVYSFGLDEDDDGAAKEMSRSARYRSPKRDDDGDITLRLYAKPRYDFPLEPRYHYRDWADWDQRYPHRLPADQFGMGGLEPLRLSRDGSNRLWSFGPDADQGMDRYPFWGRPFEGPYDPTNGVTSTGDHWIDIDFEVPVLSGYRHPHMPPGWTPPARTTPSGGP